MCIRDSCMEVPVQQILRIPEACRHGNKEIIFALEINQRRVCTPVSYTHLARRQKSRISTALMPSTLLQSPTGSRSRRRWKPPAKGRRSLISPTARQVIYAKRSPVSYTHLDVYKRQGLGCAGVLHTLTPIAGLLHIGHLFFSNN